MDTTPPRRLLGFASGLRRLAPVLAATVGWAAFAAPARAGWPTSIPSTGDALQIVSDPFDGDIYVANSFTGTVTFAPGVEIASQGQRDVYVAKYDAAGAFQWVEVVRSATDLTVGGIVLGSGGIGQEIWISGTSISSNSLEAVTFGSHTISGPYSPVANASLYLARLDEGPVGAPSWGAAFRTMPGRFHDANSSGPAGLSGDVYDIDWGPESRVEGLAMVDGLPVIAATVQGPWQTGLDFRPSPIEYTSPTGETYPHAIVISLDVDFVGTDAFPTIAGDVPVAKVWADPDGCFRYRTDRPGTTKYQHCGTVQGSGGGGVQVAEKWGRSFAQTVGGGASTAFMAYRVRRESTCSPFGCGLIDSQPAPASPIDDHHEVAVGTAGVLWDQAIGYSSAAEINAIAVDGTGSNYWASNGGGLIHKKNLAGALGFNAPVPIASPFCSGATASRVMDVELLDATTLLALVQGNGTGIAVTKATIGATDLTEVWTAEACSVTSIQATGLAPGPTSAAVGGTFSTDATFGGTTLAATGSATFLGGLELVGGNWFETFQWTVGDRITPPGGASGAQPTAKIASLAPSEAAKYVYWDAARGELYAVRAAPDLTLEWPSAGGVIPTSNAVDWPASPYLHVGGGSIIVQPASLTDRTFQQLHYPADGVVDSGIFVTPLSDYSVLRFRETDGTPTFQVALGVARNDPRLPGGIDTNCTVGTPLDPAAHAHDDPGGRGGAPALPSPIDGFGPFKAYDPVARVGDIIPVNTARASTNDLVVVWYQRDTFGLGWPRVPISYECSWPAVAEKIVVDTLVGSEYNGQALLDPAVYPEAYVYYQNDPAQLGFNPNEEHAFLALSNPRPPGGGTGSGLSAVFALRRQIDTSASEPYVLLKYRHPVSGRWAYRIFEVLETVSPTAFEYDVVAGAPVPNPYPLPILGGCPDTQGYGTPFWKDVRGNVFARANGLMQVDYFYPLKSDFYDDPGGIGQNTGTPGDCIRWLSDPSGTPRLVEYRVSWPADAPVLQVGQTLIKPTADPYGHFLPDIRGQRSAEVVFQGEGAIAGDLSPGNPAAFFADPQKLVKLYDPLIARTVSVDGADVDRFRTLIDEAPYEIAVRMRVDVLPPQLVFSGFLDDDVLGDPLLLLNVLGLAERDILKGLPSCVGNVDCEAAIDRLFEVTRNPHRLDLDGDDVPDVDNPATLTRDEGLLLGLQEVSSEPLNPGAPTNLGEPRRQDGIGGVLTAGAASAKGWVTVAFNNSPTIDSGSLPVTLQVLRVDCGAAGNPYPGQIHALPTDNVFDERLALRHSGDFGGEPERMDFDWFAMEAPWDNSLPPGSPWTDPFLTSAIQTSIEGATPRTLADSYVFVTYTDAGGVCAGPFLAGDAGSTLAAPRPKLAEGWIKRVLRALNPFHARTRDFHTSPTNTYVSLIRQAGPPFNGPVAFNGDPENVNSIGLVETYETVLRRAFELSIDAMPPVTLPSGAVDDALLLAAGRIADLEMLLGNEAWADAADPTIGFGTQSGEYGNLAPTIFAFQNQLPSLLEEELALMRGRDSTAAPVSIYPVFNRLLWNFTSGEGEVAYSQVYQITDQNSDGFLNEADARRLYPQGHGDAWGTYLTAIKSYYRLLRHPLFNWRTRAEQVNLAGVAVTVDYRDERKFAAAAAARARAGSEIVDLTYRQRYTADPELQSLGYPDDVEDRAWGVDDWSRRAAQGALFDWVAANALLPDEWEVPGAGPCATTVVEALDAPNVECPVVPSGGSFPEVGKIDRTNVPELREIATHLAEIETRLFEADQGLNPLGLAPGVVPFDIDPSLVDAGMTHFEQVAQRATKALAGTVAVFDYANRLSQSLRRNQDTLEDFRANAGDKERDFENRLLEIFGYPYSDDIGPDKTYPVGYGGADLYHWMLVDAGELTGQAGRPRETITGFYAQLPDVGFFTTPGAEPTSGILEVQFEVEPDGVGIVKPESWTGQRKAPGELQRALDAYYRALGAFDASAKTYSNHIDKIVDEVEVLDGIRSADAGAIEVLTDQQATNKTLNEKILEYKWIQIGLGQRQRFVKSTATWIDESIPDSVGLSFDALSAIKATASYAGRLAVHALDLTKDAYGIKEGQAATAKSGAELTSQIRMITDVTNRFEVAQIQKVEQALRAEPILRYDTYQKRAALTSAAGAIRTAAAKGQRILEELIAFRKSTAADVQQYRYQDYTFRVARNDALQKYRAQFDLAARYAYLAATAYDYETNLIGSANGAGQEFLTDIVRHRSLGQVLNGQPVPGSRGLADPLGRLIANFDVLKGQMGFNNPQTETTRFSLRQELLRLRDTSDEAWRDELRKYRVANLWDLQEFRRFARPFAPEPPVGPAQPGLVIGLETMGGRPLSTTVTSGLNFFSWPLGGGDSTYDPSNFATKIRSVGVWFENYNATGLSNTPRVYLLPVGADYLRPPTAGDFNVRQWNVVDQVLPVPFPIGEQDLLDPAWIPANDTLSGEIGGIRRISRFRAYHDSGGFDPSETTTDSRLIGRSVWNDRWLLIIPGETLLANPEAGLDTFLETVTDIKMFFQTYAYSGNRSANPLGDTPGDPPKGSPLSEVGVVDGGVR